MVNKRSLWTGEEIAQATGGTWISGDPKNVFTDRFSLYPFDIKTGDIVLTMSQNHWSKKYGDTTKEVLNFFSAGAVAAIVESKPDNVTNEHPILLVENTRIALDDLARFARKRLKSRILCVTGSVGKTSVCEILKHVLRRQAPTYVTLPNYNNAPMAALSLTRTPPDVDYSIYEFAVDLPSRTLNKATLISPNIALITDIKPDHLNKYPSLEALADQKSLLFDAFESDGTAILYRDTPLYERLQLAAVKKGASRILTFGQSPLSDVHLISYLLEQDSSYVEISVFGEHYKFEISLPGYHMVKNCIAALAAVVAFDANWKLAARSFSSLKPLFKHTERHKVPFRDSFIELIDDTFNASPPAVWNAIEFLNFVKPNANGKRIIVLGELYDLGDSSEKMHAGLAEHIKKTDIRHIVTFGDRLLKMHEALPKNCCVEHATSANGLLKALLPLINPNDVILFKCSYRDKAKFESVMSYLTKLTKDGTRNSKQIAKNVVDNLLVQQHTENIFIKQSEKAEFELLFLGDTSFGENYQERMKERGRVNILEEKGYDYCLKKMKPILNDADLIIANLETPVTNIKDSPFAKQKAYVHWSDVVKTPKSLLRHNINVVGLANNHIFDYGRDGFNQTLEVLNEYGIKYFGAGANEFEAMKPFLGKVNFGDKVFRFAVIAAFEELESYRKNYDCYASSTDGGVNSLSVENMSSTIKSIKDVNPDTFIILYPHWGPNYKFKTERQTRLARDLIAVGVDIIVGHGAHMMQEVEQIDGRWSAFSIGNFMFNSRGRYKKLNAPPYSFITKLIVSKRNNEFEIKLRIYPIVTDNTKTNYQPRYVNANEFKDICSFLYVGCGKKRNALKINDKDAHGHSVDISIIGPSPTFSEDTGKQVGIICNIPEGGSIKDLRYYWKDRALVVDKFLRKENVQLLLYSTKDVDLANGIVKAYCFNEDKLTAVQSEIPKVNFDWHLPLKGRPKKSGPSVSRFRKWSKNNDVKVYPTDELIEVAKDKYLTYRLISKVDPLVQPETEIYNHTIAQMEKFFKSNNLIFIKPLRGKIGNGIIVLRKEKDHFSSAFYDEMASEKCQLTSIESCLDKNNELMKDAKYIIQKGIETDRYQGATFDIRVVMLHDGAEWQWYHLLRLGVVESDLSNVSQGGSFYPTEEILNNLYGEETTQSILTRLKDISFEIINYFESEQPHLLNELVFDFILSKDHKIFLAEMNAKPGFGVLSLYKKLSDPSKVAEHVLNSYTIPHGTYLAKFLLAKVNAIYDPKHPQ